MAERKSQEEAGFWLPSEFLDDFQMDKEKLKKESDSEFFFPTEFPYDFGTKPDELVEKRWLMSTSPQSTLSHMSSWTGHSVGGSTTGSPTTPRNDSVGDLIYLAAGQVARLKLHAGDMPVPTKPKTFIAPPRALPNIFKPGTEMWQKMHQMRMVQDAWTGQLNPTRIVGSGGAAAGFGGGDTPAKRGCAGTGVFLPRRYGASSNADCKRPGYSAPSTPNRNSHAINKSFDNMNGFVKSQSHYHPKLGADLISEYDLLMARRNALLLQHQRRMLLEGSSPINRGVYLPQEWTY